MTEPLVGILGGMGPAATAAFYAKLVARTPAIRDQDHLRVAIWADPTVPDRVAALLDGSTDPYPLMLAGARHLQSLGVTIAAMPCHTAHAFLPRLIADTGLPFVDMVAETARVLRQRDARRVALLGTRGTLVSGIYQERLQDFDLAIPDEQAQQSVDEAIAAVKRGAPAEGAAPVRGASGCTVDRAGVHGAAARGRPADRLAGRIVGSDGPAGGRTDHGVPLSSPAVRHTASTAGDAAPPRSR